MHREWDWNSNISNPHAAAESKISMIYRNLEIDSDSPTDDVESNADSSQRNSSVTSVHMNMSNEDEICYKNILKHSNSFIHIFYH
jgi:hypothetical protein